MKRIAVVALISCMAISSLAYAGEWLGSEAGAWFYLKDGSQWAKNEWVQDKGFWYYFNDKGEMVKNAWIDGKYYVGSNGAMLQNTTTPDGYFVGADGAWIPDGQSAGSSSSGQTTVGFDRAVEILKGTCEKASYDGCRFAVSGNPESKVITLEARYYENDLGRISEETYIGLMKLGIESTFKDTANSLRSLYDKDIKLCTMYLLNDKLIDLAVY